MKSFFCLLLFLTSNVLFGQSNIDVLHYKYEIELSDQTDKITGRASITVQFLQAGNEVKFDLVTLDETGKGMFCTESSATNMAAIRGMNFADQYVMKLPRQMNPGDTVTFNLNYSGIPADGLIISKNKYGHRTFFADNWPNRGHNWIPCHEDPADKASVEFIVTAPQHYQVVANGIQVEETNLIGDKKRTHWTEEVPVSTKVMVIGAADFAVNLSAVVDNCIPVYSWVYPEDRENGFYDYAQAAEILPWFIKKIGPYAYKKLANVQSKTKFGGLENANTIFYSENSVTGTRQSESLLAHEIAHQWFGNYATEKSFAHLWLSEGFATYMTILYLENKYGKDTAIAMLKEDREQAIAFGKRNPLPVVNTTADYMTLLNPDSYQKGGWVLHMLHSQLGDSVFWKSIQRYYADYGGKNADTDDLRKVFEEISGQNLELFFKQWLFTPENPSLFITWHFNVKNKEIELTVRQKQETVFEMPLALFFFSGSGNAYEHIFQIKDRAHHFTIPFNKKPVEVAADQSISLLCDFELVEIK